MEILKQLVMSAKFNTISLVFFISLSISGFMKAIIGIEGLMWSKEIRITDLADERINADEKGKE
jgi:hypothetical protein